jgi:hypothetical protein
VGVFCVLTSSVSAALIIDNFTGAMQTSIGPGASPGATSNFTAPAAGAIGGFRQIGVELVAGPSIASVTVDEVGTGLLAFSSNAGTTANASVLWDGGSSSGLGGIDLTEGGANLGVVFTYRADGRANITFDIFSGAGNSSSRTLQTLDTGFGVPFLFAVLPLSSFTTSSGSGAVMTNVTAIRVSVQGIGGYDLQLDDIVMSPIPEPAAAGLVLAMAVAFPLRRRRRA